jgi:hypothetical protein
MCVKLVIYKDYNNFVFFKIVYLFRFRFILFIGSACKMSEDHIPHRYHLLCLCCKKMLYIQFPSLNFRGLCLRQVKQPTKHGLLSAMNFGYFRHPIRGSRPSGYEF